MKTINKTALKFFKRLKYLNDFNYYYVSIVNETGTQIEITKENNLISLRIKPIKRGYVIRVQIDSDNFDIVTFAFIIEQYLIKFNFLDKNLSVLVEYYNFIS